jgi:hypothetical protein
MDEWILAHSILEIGPVLWYHMKWAMNCPFTWRLFLTQGMLNLDLWPWLSLRIVYIYKTKKPKDPLPFHISQSCLLKANLTYQRARLNQHLHLYLHFLGWGLLVIIFHPWNVKIWTQRPWFSFSLRMRIYHGLKQPKCFLGDFYHGSNVGAGSPKPVVN